jgi:hypothetical protein
MHSIVTNSTVDGVLAAFFAILIVVVIADAARVWVKAIRAREPLPTTEAPPVESAARRARPGCSRRRRSARSWPGGRRRDGGSLRAQRSERQTQRSGRP